MPASYFYTSSDLLHLPINTKQTESYINILYLMIISSLLKVIKITSSQLR